MSLSELLESKSGFVLVAQKNHTRSDEIAETLETLSRSENIVLGAFLSDL
jgi:Mrp family chromosome partitioning ATPase